MVREVFGKTSYRLNVINIEIPPLRERREDIQPLAEYFIKLYGKKFFKNVTSLDRKARETLTGYDWPGNVRELENVIERGVILCESDAITEKDIAVAVKTSPKRKAGVPPLQEIERDYILTVLKQTGGNQTKASKLLGVDRKTLYLKLKKYGIST